MITSSGRIGTAKIFTPTPNFDQKIMAIPKTKTERTMEASESVSESPKMLRAVKRQRWRLVSLVVMIVAFYWSSNSGEFREEEKTSQSGWKEVDDATNRWHIVYRDTYCSHSKAVQKIFLRHGLSNNKTVMMPTSLMSKPRLAAFTPSGHSVMSYQLPRKDTGQTHYNYDLMVSNFCSVWDKQLIQTNFPKDKTFYFTLVCDPVTRIANILHKAGISVEHFAMHVDDKLEFMKMIISEQLGKQAKAHQVFSSVDLGLHVFFVQDELEIKDFLDQVSEDFHLVLVQEFLEEGLVMMKNLLNWTLLDEVTLLKPFPPEREFDLTTLTPLAEENLLAWLNPDLLMYQMFLDKFHQMYSGQAFGVKEEVATLKRSIELLTTTCAEGGSPEENFSLPCNILRTDGRDYY